MNDSLFIIGLLMKVWPKCSRFKWTRELTVEPLGDGVLYD